MKKVTLLFLFGVFFLTNFFAQIGAKAGMANEDLDQIKELKSQTLYISIEKNTVTGQKDMEKEERINTGELYKEAIEKYWRFSEYKFIDKKEYKKLAKNKKLFFLANTSAMPSYMGGNRSGKNKITRANPYAAGFLMLSKGKPSQQKVMKNTAVFTIPLSDASNIRLGGDLKELDILKLAKEQIVTEIRLLNNYLEDCIRFNSASMRSISVKNSPNLKGKKVLFNKSMVKFEQEELGGIKYFEPIVLKNREIRESFKELTTNKEMCMFKPLFAPVGVIVDRDYKICYYFKPKKAIKSRMTLEDLIELDKNVGQ
jgi:hypothetical protein